MYLTWWWLSTSRATQFLNSGDGLPLTMRRIMRLAKTGMLCAFLRDCKVHIVQIQVLAGLSWKEQVKGFRDLLEPSSYKTTNWTGQTLHIWEFDEANPIIRKWRPVFEALDSTQLEDVVVFAMEHFPNPEYRWIGCTGLKSPSALFFRM